MPSLFARCMLYEFEDIIREIDAVTMLAPKSTKFYKYGDRIANRMAHASAIAMNPGIPSSRIEGEYGLMFDVRVRQRSAISEFPKGMEGALRHVGVLDR